MSDISVQKLMPLKLLSLMSVFSNLCLPKAAIFYVIQNHRDIPYFAVPWKRRPQGEHTSHETSDHDNVSKIALP